MGEVSEDLSAPGASVTCDPGTRTIRESRSDPVRLLLVKLGWRDERSVVLPQRIIDSGLAGKSVETIIDHIEYDEGRDPVATKAWDSV